MRALAALFLLTLVPLAGQRSTPSRAELQAMERAIDNRFSRFALDSPMEVLGLTRGVYLDSYGAVFTSEVSLVPLPGISPFRPTISKEEIARIKAAKQRRIPELKTLMREALLSSAGSLDRLPPQERIVLGVALFYANWEDNAGMPQMITMQARKAALADVAASRQPRTALDSIIQVREE
jgi:hypothetical protein